MDLDIDMDVDIDNIQDAPPIPEAYTEDLITGEEQVRNRLRVPPTPPTSRPF
jgi:hypothetical protein